MHITSAANASPRLSSYQVFVPTKDPGTDHFTPGDPVSRLSPQDMQDSRVSNGTAMPTKRYVPSCSNLPNIWSPEMDRYIVRIVTLDKVRPHHLAKVVKNRFPDLIYYALTEEAIASRVRWLDESRTNDYFVKPNNELIEELEAKGVEVPVPLSEAELAIRYPSEETPMKSDLEVFGSDEPMNGLLAIGCSNDDYDPYAPPSRGLSLKGPSPKNKSTLKSKVNRTASTSQRDQDNTVHPPRPVQIAGQHVDQQNLADVTNTGNSPGAPITPASHETKSSSKGGRRKISVNANVEEPSTTYVRAVHANTEDHAVSPRGRNFNTNTDEPSTSYGRSVKGNSDNQAGSSYGRGINTNIDDSSNGHKHTSNVNYGIASNLYDRPVNTNTNQPSSPYGRAVSPTTTDLGSAYGFTYGSTNSEQTTRRPVNPNGAVPLGQYDCAVSPVTSSLSSPYGREVVANSEAPRSPHVRTGNSGHENIPRKSPSGSGGISESLGRFKLMDDPCGTQ